MSKKRNLVENESQESNHSMLDKLDALQVEEPEPYSPPAARTSRTGISLKILSKNTPATAALVDAQHLAAGSRRSRSASRSDMKLAVSGFIVEHLKTGQYIAPQNAVFVYDISDSRSVKSVQKKMNKIRREFTDKTLCEFTAKGTAETLPTSVGGASVGVLTATVAKCFESSKRARTSTSDSD